MLTILCWILLGIAALLGAAFVYMLEREAGSSVIVSLLVAVGAAPLALPIYMVIGAAIAGCVVFSAECRRDLVRGHAF